eukprot:SAG25_NODE_36_length_19907_cov_10.787027_14_plen_267_part_00
MKQPPVMSTAGEDEAQRRRTHSGCANLLSVVMSSTCGANSLVCAGVSSWTCVASTATCFGLPPPAPLVVLLLVAEPLAVSPRPRARLAGREEAPPPGPPPPAPASPILLLVVGAVFGTVGTCAGFGCLLRSALVLAQRIVLEHLVLRAGRGRGAALGVLEAEERVGRHVQGAEHLRAQHAALRRAPLLARRLGVGAWTWASIMLENQSLRHAKSSWKRSTIPRCDHALLPRNIHISYAPHIIAELKRGCGAQCPLTHIGSTNGGCK